MTLECKKKGSESSFSINVSIRSLTILHFRKDQRSDLDPDLPIIDPNAVVQTLRNAKFLNFAHPLPMSRFLTIS